MSMKATSQGFTVVELMIATTVFSVILLLCTFGILTIGKAYYKGATISNTQESARGALDTITQAIQYSSDNPSTTFTNGTGVFCIGDLQFSYAVGPKVTGTQHALVLNRKSIPACTSVNMNAALPTGARELLGNNMRLSSFYVTSSTVGYDVGIKVTFGDDDLVDLTSGPAYGNCLGGAGSEYCAVSQLDTTVHKRL